MPFTNNGATRRGAPTVVGKLDTYSTVGARVVDLPPAGCRVPTQYVVVGESRNGEIENSTIESVPSLAEFNERVIGAGGICERERHSRYRVSGSDIGANGLRSILRSWNDIWDRGPPMHCTAKPSSLILPSQ